MRYRWNYRKCFKNLWTLAKLVVVIILLLSIVSFNPYHIYTGIY